MPGGRHTSSLYTDGRAYYSRRAACFPCCSSHRSDAAPASCPPQLSTSSSSLSQERQRSPSRAVITNLFVHLCVAVSKLVPTVKTFSHTLLWPAGLPACQKCWCRRWTTMSLQIGGFYSINHKLYTTELCESVSAPPPPPPPFSCLTPESVQWIFCFLIFLSASVTVSLPFCFAFFLPVVPYPFPSDWKVKIKRPSYDVAVLWPLQFPKTELQLKDVRRLYADSVSGLESLHHDP